MPSSGIAEALYRAHKARSTGMLVIRASERASKLLLHEGDVVGAEFGFGYQSMGQALLQRKKITPLILDVLWSRGEGGTLDAESLSEHRISADEARRSQVLAGVRAMRNLAESVAFEQQAVDVSELRVPGAAAVRAAFEAGVKPQGGEELVYRCPDVEACAAWLSSPDEHELLASLQSFAAPSPLSPAHRALLEVLVLDGKVEALTVDAWEQRKAAEVARLEAEGKAAETARLEAERKAAETARLEAERKAAEVARLEAERLEAERLEAERLEAERLEAARREAERLEAERLEAERLEAERLEAERLEAERLEAERLEAERLEVERLEAERLEAARREAEVEGSAGESTQSDAPNPFDEVAWLSPADSFGDGREPTVTIEPGLLEEKLEASKEVTQVVDTGVMEQAQLEERLHRSRTVSSEHGPWTTPSTPAAESEPMIELSASEMEPAQGRAITLEVPAVQPEPTPGPRAQTLEIPAQVPVARPTADLDLWKIVEFDQQGPSLGASFDDALRNVDRKLEALIASLPPVEPMPEGPPVEVTVEAKDAWGDDNRVVSVDTASPGPDELDVADPSDPADAAKARRQRLLRRAIENIGVLGSRPPPSTEAQVSRAPAPAAPADAPTGSPEARLAEQIEKKHGEIQAKKNHFELLGLPPEATREQVKAAFLGLAKVFHPDRLPPALQPLAPKMSAVFEAVRGAYETLFDDAKRASYLNTLRTPVAPASGQANPVAVQQADEACKKGEILLRKRDFRGAEAEFNRALAMDRRAAFMAAAAWAVYMDPSRKPEAAAARQAMHEALKLDPRCDRAHYQLGVIARVEGDMERAEQFFRDAVRGNPRHLEANQELRLIEMRRKKDKKGFK